MKSYILTLFVVFTGLISNAQTDYDQAIIGSWARAGVGSLFPSGLEYGYWSLNQVAPITFSGKTTNLGDVVQTGAKLNVSVSGAESFSSTSPMVDLPIGGTDSLVASSTFTPGTLGSYEVTYWFDGTNPEEVTDNDTTVEVFQVTETEYGRDYGIQTGGISAIAGYEESPMSIGNVMEIFADDEMTSMRVQITDNPDNVDQIIYGECWIWDGVDFVFLGVTDDHVISSGENGSMIDLDFIFPIDLSAGDLILLTAGHYGGSVIPEFALAQETDPSTVLGFVDGFIFALYDPSVVMVRAVFDECAYINASESIVQISCNGESDGEIWLTPDSSHYTVIWSPSDTTDFLTGLGAGTYSYTIEDTNGCSVNGSITLVEPDLLSLSATPTNEYFGTDGTIDLEVNGGTSPYTINWTGPDGFTSTDEDISDLDPGTYSVIVVDANGCMDSLEVIVDSELGIDPSVQPELVLYPNPTNGQVSFSAKVQLVTVFDPLGQLVLSEENTTSVDLSNQAPGLYVMIIDGRTYRLEKI